MMRLLMTVLTVGLILAPIAAFCVEGKHPADVSQVVAEGEAPASEPDARDKAVADALRNCVMIGIGVYVDSTTLGGNYQVITDDILLHADGFATLDEVLSTQVKDGLFQVKVKASVSNRPLVNKLKALGLLHEWKVGVVIPEKFASNPDTVLDSAAETEIARELLNAGYRVIDERRRRELAKDEAANRASKGDKAALKLIKKEFDVDILVTGEASAEYVDQDEIGGVMFYRTRGHIIAKAYYADTGELLSMNDKFADGLDQTKILSAKKCLKELGRRAALTLSEDLMLIPASQTPYVTVKITNLTNASEASQVERAIKQIIGVTQVKRQRFSNGALEMNVYVKSAYREDLGVRIEKSQVGAKLGIVVGVWSKSLVQGRVVRS